MINVYSVKKKLLEANITNFSFNAKGKINFIQ